MDPALPTHDLISLDNAQHLQCMSSHHRGQSNNSIFRKSGQKLGSATQLSNPEHDPSNPLSTNLYVQQPEYAHFLQWLQRDERIMLLLQDSFMMLSQKINKYQSTMPGFLMRCYNVQILHQTQPRISWKECFKGQSLLVGSWVSLWVIVQNLSTADLYKEPKSKLSQQGK